MTDIQKIIKNNKIYRFALELQYTENEDSKILLKQILQNFEQNINDDYTINTDKHNLKTNIEKFNDKFNKIDELTFKKQFYRLNEIQKINKLKEYFKNNKNIVDDKMLQSHADTILEFIKNKKIKNADVEYNINSTTITNIKNINIEDDKIVIAATVKKTLKKKSSTSKE